MDNKNYLKMKVNVLSYVAALVCVMVTSACSNDGSKNKTEEVADSVDVVSVATSCNSISITEDEMNDVNKGL